MRCRVMPRLGMASYRIVPRHRAYCVEAMEGEQVTILRTWPTEEQAISHLRALKAAAAKTEPKPPPERRPGRPFSPFRIMRYE